MAGPSTPMLLLVLALLTPSLGAAEKAPKGGAEAAKPEPPKDKPFAEVVKDAKAVSGLFTVYRTDEKTYLEILPDQLDRTYYMALTLESGLGERGFYASMMGGVAPVSFHREGKTVQFVRRNTRFFAQAGSAIERAVRRSFSDSILGTTGLESLPHPERKSLLVDLGALLLADLPMLGYDLESRFRIPYAVDPKGSAFGPIKGFPGNMEIETVLRFAAEKIPVPPLPAPGAPPPQVPPPQNLADPRSMLFRLHWSLAEPPPPGFRPRLADDRVGHFFEDREDFTTDTANVPTRRFVNRWRLERAEPGSALSRPRQPIVFWLENTIPEKYRAAVREGILVWNKAFERIGFRDAIEVRQQPDDADWDAGDVRYSTVRWFATTDAVFAVGPSNADPLTGEIYDADIGFSESMTRFARHGFNEGIVPLGAPAAPGRALAAWSPRAAALACDMAEGAVRQASFGFDLLVARGLGPEGPEAEEFIRQFLVLISAHEVGHTLGLRHNFQASTIRPLEALHDKALTVREGLAGSVMDYLPANLSLDRAKQGEYYQTTIGPYDYWAVEYAYKPIDSATPEDELPELARIASRVAEPLLAYGTDEDAGFFPEPFNMDPLVNRWDLGSDPLRFYGERVRLSEEVFRNVEARLLKPGEGYQVLRRSFQNALFQSGTALALAAKYVGGVSHRRDHAGDPGGRLPFEPLPRARQEAALALLREHLFSPRAFAFPPELLNKLASERWPNWRDIRFARQRYDYPLHEQVLQLQRQVLDRLTHPIVLSRLLDGEVASRDPMRIGALFDGLRDAIWEETAAKGASLEINGYRRALQREHLRRLTGLLLRGENNPPEDARTGARSSLETLRTRIRGAIARPGLRMPDETRSHLQESLSRIEETLKAGVERQAL